jgi:hypothetical protein
MYRPESLGVHDREDWVMFWTGLVSTLPVLTL